MKDRVTPFWIDKIEENQCFVYGANTGGCHFGGAAHQALSWGAVMGHFGPSGDTYGIPTKSGGWNNGKRPWIGNTLPPKAIGSYVDKFIDYATDHPETTFFVTEIGCGLAGLKPSEVAPLFQEAIALPNVYLPPSFWDVLLGDSGPGKR